jgi:dTDP-4-dehydrorhamnose reductase
MRVLVTGARGLLGSAVVREVTKRGSEALAFDHASLDITDAAAVNDRIAAAAPDVIINCAAYNAVDEAEDRAEHALRVNALAVLALARAAEARGAMLVHYSTDFVFDGETTRPYVESDEPRPRGVYAISKCLGEWLADEYPRSYVLRVESLFGETDGDGAARGSMAAIVRGIRQGDEVPLFEDRTVSPSYTTDIARATLDLVSRAAPHGLYHCVNSGAATWLEVGGEVARLLGLPLKARPITLDSVQLRAPRPRYCALSNAKLRQAGIDMPDWRDALRRHLAAAV